MSRTRKGSKAPGWEYWGTGKKHQEPAPDYDTPDYDKLYAQWQEYEEAVDCALYGPCEVCMANKQREEEE